MICLICNDDASIEGIEMICLIFSIRSNVEHIQGDLMLRVVINEICQWEMPFPRYGVISPISAYLGIPKPLNPKPQTPIPAPPAKV